MRSGELGCLRPRVITPAVVGRRRTLCRRLTCPTDRAGFLLSGILRSDLLRSCFLRSCFLRSGFLRSGLLSARGTDAALWCGKGLVRRLVDRRTSAPGRRWRIRGHEAMPKRRRNVDGMVVKVPVPEPARPMRNASRPAEPRRRDHVPVRPVGSNSVAWSATAFGLASATTRESANSAA